MARFYELEIVMDNSGKGTSNWLVRAPAFPEVTTFPTTSARPAFRDVPAPMKTTPGKGYFVEVPALTFLKVALYRMICSRRGVTRAELTRRLDWHREQVDRLFRLDHKSRLDQMEAAFEALGISLTMDVPAIDAAA